MANTPQYAFRLPPEHVRLLNERAESLQAALGISINRTDALRLLLDFAQKVERVRKSRIQSYREMMEKLPEGAERERAKAALDDWLTMSYERMLGLAELQATASIDVNEIRKASKEAGADRLSDSEIDAEVKSVRRSRSRRR